MGADPFLGLERPRICVAWPSHPWRRILVEIPVLHAVTWPRNGSVLVIRVNSEMCQWLKCVIKVGCWVEPLCTVIMLLMCRYMCFPNRKKSQCFFSCKIMCISSLLGRRSIVISPISMFRMFMTSFWRSVMSSLVPWPNIPWRLLLKILGQVSPTVKNRAWRNLSGSGVISRETMSARTTSCDNVTLLPTAARQAGGLRDYFDRQLMTIWFNTYNFES